MSVIGLGLESSCDETSASIVKDGTEVLSNIIFSQIDIHKIYNGVVPEIASRSHLEVINKIIDSALSEANISFKDLSYVAATNRPGLIGSLLISLQSAKAISYILNIPLIGINHLEAHLYAPFLENKKPSYPFIGLLISGGNTIAYKVTAVGEMEVLGKTVDDAVGEAFDKVAKILDAGYPGGPIVEKLAQGADNHKLIFPKILTDPGDVRFSYSGLKTAVVNHCRNNDSISKENVAYSFQERALELLVRRTLFFARKEGISDIVVAGGVAANGRLREIFKNNIKGPEKLYIPTPILCTDNAAMTAGLSYHYFKKGVWEDLSIDVSAKTEDNSRTRDNA